MTDTIAMSAAPLLARKARLRFDKKRGEDLLLLPERVVKLNHTAAAILSLRDGTRSVEKITMELEKKFKQKGLGEDIEDFLRDAWKHGWLTGSPDDAS